MKKPPTLEQFRLAADVIHESSLILTILSYARSGHATIGMVEAAIEMVKRHVAFAKHDGDDSLRRSSEKLKEGLEQALIDGLQSLRGQRDVPEEFTKVEIPVAKVRELLGHRIRRQVKCEHGILDIFDFSTNEVIECKLIGSSAKLGEAAGQLRRYRKSFPDASLTIAVLYVEDEAMWLADVLRQQGISIIEVAQR